MTLPMIKRDAYNLTTPKTSTTPFNLKTKIINRNNTLIFSVIFPHQVATTFRTDQWRRHELTNHFHLARAYEDGLVPIPVSVVSLLSILLRH